MNRFLRDCLGSSIVEFTLVFPVCILVLLGTVDAGFMLNDWARANKAAYDGAHRAIVWDPIATGINNPDYASYSGYMGLSCMDKATGGLPSPQTCPTVTSSVCTGVAGSAPPYTAICSNGYSTGTEGNAAFNYIFQQMETSSGLVVCTRPNQPSCIRPQYVTISYQRNNNLGFEGRPGGLPVEVTVNITGMTSQFYFLGPLMKVFGGAINTTPAVPSYATTLISEDMCRDQTPPPPCGLRD